MESQYLDKLRIMYVELNRRFLTEVEKGTSWDELQGLLDEMKAIANHLEDIPKLVNSSETSL